MSLDVAGQLEGMRRILEDLVLPQLDDPYTLDVVRGVAATLGLLAERSADIDPFLRWDVEASVDVLRRAGVTTPDEGDGEPDDLGERHRAVRALLESSMSAIRANEEATAAFLALIPERAARYPFNRQGGR
jgi:hypothetical protein